MTGRAFRLLLAALALSSGLWTGGASAGWRPGEPMDAARSFFGAAALGEEIFVAGGASLLGPTDTVAAYDPGLDYWRPVPALPEGREQFGMAALGGRLWVAGGYVAGSSGPTADVRIYDPVTAAWTQGPDLPAPRAGHGLVAVEGRLYVVGGTGPDPAAVYRLSGDGRAWELFARLPEPRTLAGIVASGTDIHIVGGRIDAERASARTDSLDTRSGAWRRDPDLPTPRVAPAAA
ncbi:MAG: hypothetical protein HXY25_03410, partial [Alphaproteobacteria bacterium]|nr:hypothetical protein [Alphaproteobacteria bacterium]